jgi:ribosomal protein S18 acetylase RimI-like enzyme
MSASIQIQAIDDSQAALLSELAKDIYPPHYPYLWNEGGVEWYIHEYAYPLEKITKELQDPNNLHYIVYVDTKAVGYLKININTTTKNFDPATTMELERIYIYNNAIQKGIGTTLINFTNQLAKQYQKQFIVLKAMDSAHKALKFYEKHGYTIVGNYRLPDEVFTLMKPEYRGMYILKAIVPL